MKTNLSWVNDRPTRSPEALARRVDFFESRIAARKNPANCGKCGKSRDRAGRMCERCLNTQRRRVALGQGKAFLKGDTFTATQLAGMVLQMRREMDKIQVRFKLWNKAAKYSATLKARTNAMRRKYQPEEISKAQAMEYLSTTNHAYEPNEL